MTSFQFLAFQTSSDLQEWLAVHHETEKELWVKIFKKGSGKPTVSWNDCVIAAITWGWIDGQKRSLDAESYLQRLTPRRAKSNWSKRNCEHAERLIESGHMKASGLVHIEAARQDGRWENAYSGSADMTIPEDFLTELKKNPKASVFFETLNRSNLYVIYYSLHTAKRAETRKKRMIDIIAKLARGVKLQ